VTEEAETARVTVSGGGRAKTSMRAGSARLRTTGTVGDSARDIVVSRARRYSGEGGGVLIDAAWRKCDVLERVRGRSSGHGDHDHDGGSNGRPVTFA